MRAGTDVSATGEQTEPVSEVLSRVALSGNRFALRMENVHAIVDPYEIFYQEGISCLVDKMGSVLSGYGSISASLDGIQIPALDDHVVRIALDHLETDVRGTLGLKVSIATMSNPVRWSDIYDQILSRRYLAPRLVIEIAASLPPDRISVANIMLAMAEVQGLGCKVALDDFWLDLAEHKALLAMNLDVIKINAPSAFGPHGGADRCDALRRVIGLARLFAPAVVIKGVKGIDQVNTVRNMGATHLQQASPSILQVLAGL